MSITTLNSFILLKATCSLTIQCISMATQYSLLLTKTYIVPQYKRSTLLYFHGNTFSSCILLIMTCNNSTKKNALLFPWLQWLMQTCYYITLYIHSSSSSKCKFCQILCYNSSVSFTHLHHPIHMQDPLQLPRVYYSTI